MIAVFAVLAAIAMVSGWRGERWVRLWLIMRWKVLAFSLILVVLHVSAAYSFHLEVRAFYIPIVFVFDLLLVVTVTLIFYSVGRLGNAMHSS